MQSANSIVDVGTLTQDARHGPLQLLLIVLTVVTGLVDVASYLKLGHVFVANDTCIPGRGRTRVVLPHCDGTQFAEQRAVSPRSGDMSSRAFAGHFSETTTAREVPL